MRLFFILFFIFSASFAEDFITPLEYGKMLYQNPRGVGCDKCHGLRGGGKVIAYYKYQNKKKKLVAPPIYDISKRDFLNSFRKKSKVMPTYFLTKDEMKSLYDYIQSVNSKKTKE